MLRRRRTPSPPRLDRLRIAELEYELFGIEPEPGTAAAFAVGMRHLAAALKPERRGVGGHASSDATIHDLPPLPDSLVQHPD